MAPALVHTFRHHVITTPRARVFVHTLRYHSSTADGHSSTTDGHSITTDGHNITTDGPAKDPKPLKPGIMYSEGQIKNLPYRLNKLFPAWSLTPTRSGITREYTFDSFTKAWRFMKIIANQCKMKNHHPRWTNLHRKVTIEWTTHKPRGISLKDVEMAEYCDKKAKEFGFKEPIESTLNHKDAKTHNQPRSE